MPQPKHSVALIQCTNAEEFKGSEHLSHVLLIVALMVFLDRFVKLVIRSLFHGLCVGRIEVSTVPHRKSALGIRDDATQL